MLTAVAALEPNETVAPDAKPEPEIVTTAPPLVDPDEGATAAIDGGGATGTSNVNAPAMRPLWPSGFVTTTSAAPAAWAGVIAVIDVALTTATFAAAVPPIDTVAPVAKPLPVIVTPSPPPTGPEPGPIPDTLGAATVGAGGVGEGEGADGEDPPQANPNAVSVASATCTARVVRLCSVCMLKNV